MNSKLKLFMRKLIENQGSINQYIDTLYEKGNADDINEIIGILKQEGYINCIYADDRAYHVSLTFIGKNINYDDLRLSDKEELILLIENIDDINKLFHKNRGGYIDYEMVYDVQEFQDWLQQIILYLQAIFDRTKDTYIFNTLGICRSNMNGQNDRSVFNKIAAALKSIRRNIDKYYEVETDMEMGENIVSMKKAPLIFISHSSKDVKFAELIVKLLREMGLTQKHVFCSSVPGYDIGLSEDITETLWNKFSEYNLYMIFIHSPNYYSSAVSLNEMGAAWVLKTKFCSILLPKFDFSEMKGVVNANKISLKVDKERLEVQNKLNQLYDDLASYFGIERNTSITWESARDEFIDKMNLLNVESDNQVGDDGLKILLEANKDDRGIVMIVKTLEGTSIQAGKTVMNKAGLHREEAKMYASVLELIKGGYLSQTDEKGLIFQLTNDAYRYIDEYLNR